jgi:hypothetical protein
MRHLLTRFASSFPETAQTIDRLDDWDIATKEEHCAPRRGRGVWLVRVYLSPTVKCATM